MSGSTIGGIVGGVVGFIVTGYNPEGFAYGYTIGAALGGYVDPAPGAHTYGPQLSDLSAKSADYGAAIPRVIGSARVSGDLIYCQQAQKHTHTQSSGGKGGGGATQTTYTYTRTMALALCEGEAAVLWVKVGGKLIYDASSADPATLMAQVTGNDAVTIYPGSETQMPDPDIAAAMGAGGVPVAVPVGSYQSTTSVPANALLPAFRGTCYIVLPDYDVTDYGGYAPPVEAMVVSAGSVTTTLISGPFTGGASANPYGLQQVLEGGLTVWCGGNDTNYNASYGVRLGSTLVRDVINPAIPVDSFGTQFTHYNGVSYSPYALGSIYPDPTFYLIDLRDRSSTPLVRQPHTTLGWVAAGGYAALIGTTVFFDTGFVSLSQKGFASATLDGDTLTEHATYRTNYSNFLAGTWIDGEPVLLVENSSTVTVYDVSFNAIVTVPSASMPGNWRKGHLIDGYLTVCTASALQEWQWNGSAWTQTWSTSSGSVTSATAFVVERQRRIIYWVKTSGSIQYWVYHASGVLTSSNVTVEDIILSLCTEGGLTAADVDASACAGITLPGYARTRVTTPRAALQPLLQAFQIDAIESGAVYKFVPRGQGAVITVDPLDLGAYDEGETPPSELQSTRTQAAELPRQVTMTYQDTTRDGQSGSQIVRRLDAPDSGVVSVSFPGLMTPDQAAQCADVILRVAWRERTNRGVQLPHTYLRVEPGDILEWAGYQLRVTRTDGVVPGTIKIQALDENPADYSSAATGMTVASASALAINGPSDLLVLDVPALRDEDAATPGLYLAACGYLSGWRGCALQRSADGGASWSQFGAIGQPGVIGQAIDVLGAGPTTIVDRSSSVTVRLFYGAGALGSISDADLLNGLNTVLIGDEWVGVRDATLNADGTYTLSTFLRGRFGTEDAVATHKAGDRVLLVTSQGWTRENESSASVGKTLEYRAPSAGQYGEQAEVKSLTFSARSSKPWSPCHLAAAHKSNGDILLTWIRRTRLHTNWQTGTAPLGEDSEHYDLELLDNAGAVVRTVSALTSPNYTYTTADQTADGNVAVSWRIYQISATVGRGIPAEGTL